MVGKVNWKLFELYLSGIIEGEIIEISTTIENLKDSMVIVSTTSPLALSDLYRRRMDCGE